MLRIALAGSRTAGRLSRKLDRRPPRRPVLLLLDLFFHLRQIPLWIRLNFGDATGAADVNRRAIDRNRGDWLAHRTQRLAGDRTRLLPAIRIVRREACIGFRLTSRCYLRRGGRCRSTGGAQIRSTHTRAHPATACAIGVCAMRRRDGGQK